MTNANLVALNSSIQELDLSDEPQEKRDSF